MKNLLPFLIMLLLVASCGQDNSTVEQAIASKDLSLLQQTREKIAVQLKATENKIQQLDSAILALDTTAQLPLVSTLKITPTNFKHYLELQGDVMTDQNVLVYPEMAGTLYRVYVKEGQRVSKGQLLASIDDGGLSNQVAQVKTQLDLAKTTFERQKRLWEQNIGSELQYLQAKSQYEAQESALKQLESQLGKASIRAPFSGIVDNVIKEQGTVVSPGPGAEIFRIVNLNNMYVSVQVPEAHLGTVTPGKAVEVYLPVLGKSISSKIRQTGNFINPGNRSFTAEIPVPNTKNTIKPNLVVTAKINDYTSPKAILIPQSVVSENANGEQYVYLAKKDGEQTVAQKTIITLGKTQDDSVEVLTGLQDGQNIIVEGARSVQDKQQIQVKG